MISWAITRPNAWPLGSLRRQRVWAKDRREAAAELDPYLGLLVGGKHVDHPIHRLGGGAGVERGENEMTGFGGRDRQLNRFEVAQFPHQDHVGIFTQRCSEGIAEGSWCLR